METHLDCNSLKIGFESVKINNIFFLRLNKTKTSVIAWRGKSTNIYKHVKTKREETNKKKRKSMLWEQAISLF
jgi:hypothetical protein